MVYFTSDLHLFHGNIIQYDQRPFTSINHMHDRIIKNWHATVKNDDIVYVLGDVSFGPEDRTNQFINSLPGKKYLIPGNHDRITRLKDCFVVLPALVELSINNHYIVMCHFPLESWNRSHRGSWHIHGHCHKRRDIKPIANRVNVGCMLWNYTPISILQLEQKINENLSSGLRNNDI